MLNFTYLLATSTMTGLKPQDYESMGPDPFSLNKERSKPLGEVERGYKDVIWINKFKEILEEKYLQIVKKLTSKSSKSSAQPVESNKSTSKSPRNKTDLCIYITRKINQTETTTPLNPENKSKQAMNLLDKYERPMKEMVKLSTGERSKIIPYIYVFGTMANKLAINEEHRSAWNAFFESFEGLLADDPACTNRYKRTATDSPQLSSTPVQPGSRVASDGVGSPAAKKMKVDAEESKDPKLDQMVKLVDILQKSDARDDAKEKREVEQHEMQKREFEMKMKVLEMQLNRQ